jgi:hypothetical protein
MPAANVVPHLTRVVVVVVVIHIAPWARDPRTD